MVMLLCRSEVLFELLNSFITTQARTIKISHLSTALHAICVRVDTSVCVF